VHLTRLPVGGLNDRDTTTMTYLWRISDDYPQALMGEYQREGAPDRFLFKRGELLPADIGVPVIKFNAPIRRLCEFDCLVSSVMVPLVNSKFAAILSDAAPSDVQLLKVKVAGIDGELDGFSLLNLTNKINGIDHDSSEFKCVPGTQKIMSFSKLEYVEGCMGDHGLARDAEYLSHVLVSDTVAERLLRESLKGVELVKPVDIAW
jgi:hypothetical protein